MEEYYESEITKTRSEFLESGEKSISMHIVINWYILYKFAHFPPSIPINR